MRNSPQPDPGATVLAYHERTKHRLERYAPGPETLDWDAQPAPFRSYEGTAHVRLPLLEELPADHPVARAFAQPFALGRRGELQQPALPLLGVLLQAALGVTAWKSYGPDRWAVRANPSSGNLHPVEAYVIATGLPFLDDGVYHYEPREHVLELRARLTAAHGCAAALHVGLSSVMWREAWKYGERAFRYCQLDVGHARAGLEIAAGILGLTTRARAEVSASELAALLGLDRAQDRTETRAPHTEREEPEVLLQLLPQEAAALPAAAQLQFCGRASPIDAHPFYRWPVIDEVAAATRAEIPESGKLPRSPCDASSRSARAVIFGRRSAQRFDIQHVLAQEDFLTILRPLQQAQLDLVLFVHRVQGLTPGLYLLPRSGDAAPLLAALSKQYHPVHVPVPALVPAQQGERSGTGTCTETSIRQVPLLQLCETEAKQLMRVARTLHCAQDIAASSCFALGMLAELEPQVRARPGAYRALLREAGAIGQLLYLQAEAVGMRGTGIGCYFDDAVHELLGLGGSGFQSLYHFTVGRALEDARIETGPAYPGRIS